MARGDLARALRRSGVSEDLSEMDECVGGGITATISLLQ